MTKTPTPQDAETPEINVKVGDHSFQTMAAFTAYSDGRKDGWNACIKAFGKEQPVEKPVAQLTEEDLIIGERYDLEHVGSCLYDGLDNYMGETTYKFYSLEYKDQRYEKNLNRVSFIEKPAVSGDEDTMPRETVLQNKLDDVDVWLSDVPGNSRDAKLAWLFEDRQVLMKAAQKAASPAPQDAITECATCEGHGVVASGKVDMHSGEYMEQDCPACNAAPPPENRAALDEYQDAICALDRKLTNLLRQCCHPVPCRAQEKHASTIANARNRAALSAPPYKPAAPDELIREMLKTLKNISESSRVLAQSGIKYDPSHYESTVFMHGRWADEATAKATAHLEKEG